MTKKMKVQLDLSPENLRQINDDPELKAALDQFVKWAEGLSVDDVESIDFATDNGEEVEVGSGDFEGTIRKLSSEEARDFNRKRNSN